MSPFAAMRVTVLAAVLVHAPGARAFETQTVSDQANFIDRLRAAAETGDAIAQIGLAFRLMEGHGVPKDEEQAVRWLSAAAAQNNPLAQLALGGWNAGANHRSAARDVPEAIRWYTLAALHEPASRPSHTPPADLFESEILNLKRVSEDAPAQAAVTLGDWYDSGEFVARDPAQALRWYKRGADLGAQSAQWHLGRIYESGNGVPQDRVEAEMWFIVASAPTAEHSENRIYAQSRDTLAKTLPPAELELARTRAKAWTVRGKRPDF